MSSLSLINEMLGYLGATTETNETPNEPTTSGGNDKTTNTENETKLSDEIDLSGDITLTLRGIPEFENYPYKQGSDKFLFMADICAPLFRKKLTRAAIDLVCVIDESGSMDGDRIKLVKQTVEFIIKNLESNDRFGLIGFAQESRQILALTNMNTNGKDMALSECDKIKANGGTALCAGLINGIQMLKKRNKNTDMFNNIASIMLFTDGKANRGITNKIKILNEMDKYMLGNENEKENEINNKQKQKEQIKINNNNNNTVGSDEKQLQNEGQKNNNNNINNEAEKEGKNNEETEEIFSCSINTFGFGKDHNAALLQEIAERGNGMYSFIETQDYISETFAEALGGLVSVCGQNLYVNVKALNNISINKCMSKRFKKKEIVKGKEIQIIIPDIQSEEKRSLVFELSVPAMVDSTADADDDDEKTQNEEEKDFGIIAFSVEYKNTIIEKKERLQTVCTINRISGGLDVIGLRNMELDIQNNRIIAADAMEQANNFAENSKLNEARKVIKNAQKIISSSRSKDETFCATLVHDLEQCLKKLVSQYEYASSGRQYMMMNSMSHYNQRSTQSRNMNNFSQAAYCTTARGAMMTNFTPPNINNNQKK